MTAATPETGRTRLTVKPGKPIWILLAFSSLAVALFCAWVNLPLSNDGVVYLDLARDLVTGRFRDCVFPPGFPAAIALLNGFRVPLIMAARGVMIVSAAALPLLLAAAFRRSMGDRAAVTAGFCWLVFPLHAAMASGVWSEPLFYCLALVFLGLPDVQGPRYLLTAPAGGLLGAAAYLVRPEGALIFAMDMARRVLLAARGGRARALRHAGLSVVVFAVCIAPYVLFLHAGTGQWMLSGKTRFNYAIAERMSSGNVWQPSTTSTGAVSGGVQAAAGRYVRNGLKMHTVMLSLMSLPGLLLIGCGLKALIDTRRHTCLAQTLALVSPCLVLPLFFIVESRLLFGGALGAVALLGAGVNSLSSPSATQPSEARGRRVAHRIVATGLTAATLMFWAVQGRSTFDTRQGSNNVRRALGHAATAAVRGKRMFSISLVTPFYAAAEFAGFPTGIGVERLVCLARERNVPFVEVSSYDAEAFHPSVLALVKRPDSDPRFTCVATVTSSWGDVFCIFRIEQNE
jgi:hypothetical protein